MNIHQLSVTYVIEQDRLLVQASTLAGELLSAWLTRRLTANLHPHLLQLARDGELNNAQLWPMDEAASKMMLDFKKQEALLQGDFKTPFNQQACKCPLGPEPLLATTVNFTPLAHAGLRVEFQELLAHSPEKRSFQLTLVAENLYGFMHLLDNAIKSSGWGDREASNTESTEDAFNHQGLAQVPPTYLN
jgi:hypothetical protein